MLKIKHCQQPWQKSVVGDNKEKQKLKEFLKRLETDIETKTDQYNRMYDELFVKGDDEISINSNLLLESEKSLMDHINQLIQEDIVDDFSCLFCNDKNDDGKYDIENFRWMLSVISMTVYCTFIDCLEKKWKIGNYNLFEEEKKRCFILVDPVIDFCVNSIQEYLDCICKEKNNGTAAASIQD